MPSEKSVVLGTPDTEGTTVIGLVSDTHGLLRSEVLDAFQGVTGIVHVGDIGRTEILESLREIASTVAVRGNVDTGAWAAQLPLSVVVTVGEVRIYVYHGHEASELDSIRASCQVVVTALSH